MLSNCLRRIFEYVLLYSVDCKFVMFIMKILSISIPRELSVDFDLLNLLVIKMSSF